MVLSDRFGAKPKPSLMKRTLIYVLSFGLGALLIVGLMSVTFVTIADSLLPSSKDKPTSSRKADDGADDADKTRPSKASRGRGKAADGEL
jgi:hypothetical protein